MKKLYLLLAVLVITLILLPFLPQKIIASETTVTAVVPLHFPPYYMVDEHGKPTGFAIDLMNEVAKLSGIKIEYIVKDSWAEVNNALINESVDLIPNQGITDDRRMSYNFTSPVEIFPVVIFVRKKYREIKGAADLPGHRVAVVKTNIGISLMEDIDDISLVIFDTPTETLFALLAGDVDAAVYPEPVFEMAARQINVYDKIKTVGDPLAEIKRAIAVQKGNTELLDVLNRSVNSFVGTAEYQAIYARWFGKKESFRIVTNVVIIMGAVIFVILVCLGLWCFMTIKKLNRKLVVSLENLEKQQNKLQFYSRQTVEPIRDKNGRIINYVSVSSDMTREVEIEKKLHQVQKLEAIGTLASGIAHDFNNILTPIIGYTEMNIEDASGNDQLRCNLKEVLKASNRAKDLIQHILAFSRESVMERKPLRIQTVLKEALKLLRASLPMTIEIKKAINPGCGPVKADPIEVHQIIMNLCTNAYHAMREKGGILKVGLTEVELDPENAAHFRELKSGSYLRLSVSDTGHGMERSVMERIFEPYFTTKRRGEGTGLGLATVHGIVSGLGGDISVDSQVGKGTTFHVYLHLNGEKTAAQSTEAAEEVPGGDERILLVDDEEQVTGMVEEMLERQGYRITAVTSSLTALSIFKDRPDEFDLVITDMTMPKMTGADLTEKILRIRPDIPIIMCTGFSEIMNEEKAKAIGVREFVMKPLIKSEICKTIRQVLDTGKMKDG